MNRRLILLTAGAAILAGVATAQSITVVGTGDPTKDIPAVQAAVDQGGQVVLAGNFSFDAPPNAPAGATYYRMVTVSKPVEISGIPDENGDLPTIQGGQWPFFIDAFGARVTIQRLHFAGQKAGAIWVYGVSGLAISGCRIESITATTDYGPQTQAGALLAFGIFAGTSTSPTNPGNPENFSGTLVIVNNDIDMAGAAGTRALGVALFSVGKSPDQEVDLYFSGNNIRNVTQPALEFRLTGGRTQVDRNAIVTGVARGDSPNPDVFRMVGSGPYLIAHNSIDCGWADGAATGINVFGQAPPLPSEAGAIIVDNDVTMSAPEGTVFASNSAGIEIGGPASGNAVLNNRIHGRAAAALSVFNRNGATPANTTLVTNDWQAFQPSVAGVFVDAGAANTVIVGHLSNVQDHGSGTIVVPMQ